MSSDREIFVWQPLLTDHARFTLEALASRIGVEIKAVSEAREDKIRAKHGWTNTQTELVKEVPTIRWRSILSLCKSKNPHTDRVDIFWAPFWRPKLLFAMAIASLNGSRIFLVSEPYPVQPTSYFGFKRSAVDHIKSLLRPFLYRAFIFFGGGRIKGIFAISKLAVSQYTAAGYPSSQIHPFGYFVPTFAPDKTTNEKNAERIGAKLTLVFVGSLIHRKGPDILIDAVRKANSQGQRFSASYYGPGDSALFDFDGESNIYKGEIPFGSSGKIMSTYDVVVVPSRHDGWAVVVNEAIGAGVAVICSRSVGAATLVEKFGAGLLFDHELEGSLLAVLDSIHENPSLIYDMRVRGTEASQFIQPEAAASYMESVLYAEPADPKPLSPWY